MTTALSISPFMHSCNIRTPADIDKASSLFQDTHNSSFPSSLILGIVQKVEEIVSRTPSFDQVIYLDTREYPGLERSVVLQRTPGSSYIINIIFDRAYLGDITVYNARREIAMAISSSGEKRLCYTIKTQLPYDEVVKRGLCSTESYNFRRFEGVEGILSYRAISDYPDPSGHYVENILVPYVKPLNEVELTFEELWNIMGDLIRTLHKIHEQGFFYGDLNPEGILIEEKGGRKRAILGDLHECRPLSFFKDPDNWEIIQPHKDYRAPEIAERLETKAGAIEDFSKCDLWSVGMIALTFIKGSPVPPKKENGWVEEYLSSTAMPQEAKLPMLIRVLLTPDPRYRWGMREILGLVGPQA